MNLEDLDLNQLNMYHFGTALYIQRKIAPWNDETRSNNKKAKPKQPLWKKKIQKRIDQLRAEISQMTTKEPLTRHLLNRLKRLKRKYNISQDNFNARIAEHSTQLKALTA